MNFAILRGRGLINNLIFDRSSFANRDDCFAPYSLLKNKFLDAGFDINTADFLHLHPSPCFELHQDVQSVTSTAFTYLLLFETKFVNRDNGKLASWSKYRKIFTWNDQLVDGDRFIKINFPNPVRIHKVDGFSGRPRFCCLISGNKTLSIVNSRDLYLERLKAIRWFEQNAPEDFDLYGTDWDLPALGSGMLGMISRRVFRKISPLIQFNSFPSYRGKISRKQDVLTQTRFAICYENVYDCPGYITEKIFDCFFSGCVPVYWGANNITDHISDDCFIDRRKFRDTSEVYAFLKAITESEFNGYQNRIAHFLSSPAAFPFSSEYFANTIVNTVIQDIGI